MKIFISYARADDERFARDLYHLLQENDFDVWWDKEKMESRGLTFHQEIRDAIAETDRVLVVVGPAALASFYVRKEWEHALLYAKAVTAILRVGDYEQIPPELCKYHAVNFTKEAPWDSSVEELLRILRTPVQPLGPILTSMPSLPPHFLPLFELLQRLRERILADVREGSLVDGDNRVTGICGIGGVGKTSLAIAIARSVEVRRAFKDGIIWLNVGPEANAGTLLRRIGMALGDLPYHYADVETGHARIIQILQEKTCLIVMDNVWEMGSVAQIRSALGTRARLLLTTRNAGVLTGLGIQPSEIDAFGKYDSLALLSLWADQTIEELPSVAGGIAIRVGNLPLALALCGALYRDGLNWQAIIELLDTANMEAIGREFPDYPYPDVFRAFQVSFEYLTHRAPRIAARYRELVIFTKGPVPTTEAISILWNQTAQLSAAECERILIDLSQRAMVRVRKEVGRVSIELHPLLQDFICSLVQEDTAKLHAQFMEGCKAKYSDGWYACGAEPYLVQKLPYHMKAAGWVTDLRALLKDQRWLASKIHRRGVVEAVSDFSLTTGDQDLDGISRALELSATQLERDSGQLVPHVWARMIGSVETEIVGIRNEFVEAASGAWLKTLRPSFAPVDGPLCWSITLEEHPFSLAVSKDGKNAYIGGKNSIAVVDIKQRRKVENLTGSQGSVYALSVSPDGKWLAAGTSEGDIRVWDLERNRMSFWVTVYSTKTVKDQVAEISWFPDSQHIATGSILGGGLAVWNVSTLGQGAICRMEPRGTTLYALSQLLDGPSSKENPVLCVRKAHDGYVNALAIAHDGKRIVSAGSDGKVKIWDVCSIGGRVLSDAVGAELPLVDSIVCGSEGIGALALSDDSHMLFLGSGDGKVRALNFDRKVFSEFGESKGRVTKILLARKQDRVISGGTDSIIRLYGLTEEESQVDLQGHGSSITSIAQLGESSQILSCSGDKTLKLWDLKNAKPNSLFHRHKAEVICVTLSNNESACLTISRDGEVVRWSFSDMNVIERYGGHEFWVSKGKVWEINCVTVSATSNGKTAFAGNDDGSIVEWRLDKSRPSVLIRPADPRRQQFEERCKHSPQAFNASLLNGTYAKLVTRLSSAVCEIAVSGDGRWLAWSERDGSFKVLELGWIKIGLVDLASSIDGTVSALAFSPDSRSLIIAMDSGIIKVWNMRARSWMEPCHEVLKCPSAVAMSSDLRYAAAGDTEGRVAIWELGRQDPVATLLLENSIKCIAISQRSNCIVVGDAGGNVHFLRLEGASGW